MGQEGNVLFAFHPKATKHPLQAGLLACPFDATFPSALQTVV